MLKINLGSGPSSARGWLNYDWGLLPLIGSLGLTRLLVYLRLLDKKYDWDWPKIKFVDLRQGLPDEDETVNFIYCSNVLEHFEKYEAKNILGECYRVLKKDGLMRVVLPDLKMLIKNYVTADDFNREYFGFDKDLFGGFWGKVKMMFIRGHRWMYDKKSFKKMLVSAGFANIQLKRFGAGDIPDIKDLDLKVHEKLCFYYECKK